MSELDRSRLVLAAPGPGGEAAFLATWEALEAAYFARLQEALEPHTGWRDSFRAGAKLTLELAEANRREARFLAVDSLAAGELGRERQRALGARVAILVDSARDELVNPEMVPVATAGWIVATFFDHIFRRCSTGQGPELPAQLPELLFLGVSAYFGTEAGLSELS